MQKLLIYWVSGATLLLSGCSSVERVSDAIPDALDRLPVVYRPHVQQGNTINQEMVNKLKPGMTKNQVRYLLGTPMLIDVFHNNRWDYYYSLRRGQEVKSQKQVTLFFKDDRLVRIEGDYRPLPEPELGEAKETVVSVPDYTARKKSLLSRALDTLGIDQSDVTEVVEDEETPIREMESIPGREEGKQ